MEIFAKIVNGFQSLAISAKSSILDVRLGSKFASADFENVNLRTSVESKLPWSDTQNHLEFGPGQRCFKVPLKSFFTDL